MKRIIETAWAELQRLRWELLVLCACLTVAWFVGMSRANYEVLIYKFLIYTPALILVHSSRRVLFPYIDIKAVMLGTTSERDGVSWKGKSANVRAAVVLFMAAWYVGLTSALTQAI